MKRTPLINLFLAILVLGITGIGQAANPIAKATIGLVNVLEGPIDWAWTPIQKGVIDPLNYAISGSPKKAITETYWSPPEAAMEYIVGIPELLRRTGTGIAQILTAPTPVEINKDPEGFFGWLAESIAGN